MASTDFNLDELVSPTELKLLGAKEKGIFYTQEVFGEGEKKNVKEKKKICVSSKRLYILNIQGKPPKLDLSLSLLAICELSSPTPDKVTLAYNIDQHSDKAKQVKFEVKGESCVELLAAILSPLHSTLGKDSLQRRLKLKLTGEGRQEKLDEIVDENVARVSQGWQGGSVSEVYALLCDFFDISFHDEIAWDLENTYQTHSIRTLSLNHFDHFPTRDFVPLIRMLEFCPRFEGISADGIKLCSESFDALIHISKYSSNLHFLSLRGIAGLNHKIAQKMFTQGFATNHNCALEKIDLTDTIIEEKGVESLASSVQHFPLGLRELKLSGVGISSKSFANFSKHFIKHSEISNTLTILDLSNNHFSSSSSDLQSFLAFLAGNNRIQELSLASTNVPFEQLFTALQRGCTMHLTCLNISGNSKPAIGKVQAKSTTMKQFFQTTIGLKQINLSNCKLCADLILQILSGLKENISIFSLQMNLSQNDLGSGHKEIAASLSEISCIDSLDLSYTYLDSDYGDVIGSLLKNTSIKHLDISGNIRKQKSAAAKVLEESNSSQKCKLETLKLNDCKLSDNISYVLHGLIRNSNLKRLEISGNLMGASSFRQLAKLINNNCVLEAIEFDDNLTNISSLNILAEALENNFNIQEMSIHFKDIVKLKKENDKEVEIALSKISKLLARNQSPLKREQALGGIRKRIDLLIAEQQLILDKKIVELDEEIHLFDITNLTESRKEIISKANNLKAKASIVTTLCENFYSNKLETEISIRLSELINEQSETDLLPQILTYRDKIMTDMLEKLEYSLGDVISTDKIEELKENLSTSDNHNVLTEDTLSVFSSGLASSVNASNLKMVETLILQTCELVVKELDVMYQQVSNLETTEFPKSPDRNVSGGTSRLKLAFSLSIKRHRVSYSTYNPEFNVDAKSEDLDDFEKDSQPPDFAADPVPKILHTAPSSDVADTHIVSEDATGDSTQETATKLGKRFGKPKFMTSLKGKKEDKEKKSKPAKRNDSISSQKKAETDSLPDISTFDDLSKVATQAPDLDMLKSKPKGPPRRPPRRKERTASDTGQEERDLFTEISNASAPGFENVPETEDVSDGKDRSQLNLEITEQTADQPESTEDKKAGPPTSPRKPLKMPIGMGPGLASVLQGGLGKAKLAATKSHDNIFEEFASEEDFTKRKLSDRTVRKTDSQPIPSRPKPKQRGDSKTIKLPEDSNELPVAAKPKLDTITDSTPNEAPISKIEDTTGSTIPKLEEDSVSSGTKLEDTPASVSPGAKSEDTPVFPGPKLEESDVSPEKQEVPQSPDPKPEEDIVPTELTESKIEEATLLSESKIDESSVTIESKLDETTSAIEQKSEDIKTVTEHVGSSGAGIDEGEGGKEMAEKPAESNTVENVAEIVKDSNSPKAEIPSSNNTEEDKSAKEPDTSVKPVTSPPVTARRPTIPSPKKPQKATEPGEEETVGKLLTSQINQSIIGEGDIRKSPSVSKKPILPKDKKPQIANRPKPTTVKQALNPTPVLAKDELSGQSSGKIEAEEVKEKVEGGEVKEKVEGGEVKEKVEGGEVKEKVEGGEDVPKKETQNPITHSNSEDFQELTSSTEGNISPPVKAKPTTPVKPKRISLEAIEMNKSGQKPPTKVDGESPEASNLPESIDSETKEKEQSDSSHTSTVESI